MTHNSPKTPRMLALEHELGAPLEAVLPSLYEREGYHGAAREIGIAPSTLGAWLARLRIETRTVATGPGEQATVTGRAA